jgi:hypothetical protein
LIWIIAVLCTALLPGFVFTVLFVTVLNLRTPPIAGTRLGRVQGKGWHDD